MNKAQRIAHLLFNISYFVKKFKESNFTKDPYINNNRYIKLPNEEQEVTDKIEDTFDEINKILDEFNGSGFYRIELNRDKINYPNRYYIIVYYSVMDGISGMYVADIIFHLRIDASLLNNSGFEITLNRGSGYTRNIERKYFLKEYFMDIFHQYLSEEFKRERI